MVKKLLLVLAVVAIAQVAAGGTSLAVGSVLLPKPVNSDATTDSRSDLFPELGTDGQGRWIAVWREFDIWLAVSDDQGTNWTTPKRLGTPGFGWGPSLATDRSGVWVLVFVVEGAAGADEDIMFSRSTDNGDTWSPPALLNTNAGTDAGDDQEPDVSRDSLGNWITIWHSNDTLGGSIGSDSDILFSRSTDAGITWSDPVPLNTDAASDVADDESPVLEPGGEGNWLAAWQADTIGGSSVQEGDVFYSRSLDGGNTWSDARRSIAMRQ